MLIYFCSRCCALGPHLELLIEHCEVLHGAACGLSSIDVQSCLTNWRIKPADTVIFPIRKLDLQYNSSLLLYCEYDWFLSSISASDTTRSENKEDIWLEFCTILFTHSPSLVEVNLSHIVNSLTQANVFCKGIEIALIERHKLRLQPLNNLVMNGLQKKFPSLVNEFKTTVTDSEGRLQGVLNIDCSGSSIFL